ncbi:MAG: adenylosuccinate synthetase [Myxococcales bacterium]
MSPRHRHPIVAGLGFGDEGKGTVTDFLVRQTGARSVVRYNGGPQAGHNVVTPDGRWHCFAQLGAGSFVAGTRTILGPRMLVELETLAVEADVLEGKGVPRPLSAVTIDPDCTVVTPMHKMLGQLAEESRGDQRFGTCGMGVGEAVRRREQGEGLRVGDLLAGRCGLARLQELRERTVAQAEALVARSPTPKMQELLRYFRERCDPPRLFVRYGEILQQCSLAPAREAVGSTGGPVVFEGAQGALLDRQHGFAPYVTQSRTSAHPALDLLGDGPAIKVGVLRAYGHRHGPGPFPTEDPALSGPLADPYNRENRWQGRFRLGWLDLVMLRYGLRLNGGVDWLAVTGLDRLAGLETVRVCMSYAFEGDAKLLDGWALWEARGGGEKKIVALTGHRDGLPDHAAEVLARCRPLDWSEVPGWSQADSGSLPQARRFAWRCPGPDRAARARAGPGHSRRARLGGARRGPQARDGQARLAGLTAEPGGSMRLSFESTLAALAALVAATACSPRFPVSEESKLSCRSDQDCPEDWGCDVGEGFCHLKSKPYDPPRPALVFSAPRDGSQEVAVNTLVVFAFSMPVDAASLQAKVHLASGIGEETVTLTEPAAGTFQLEPAQPLRPHSDYTLTIDAGVAPAKGTPGAASLSAQAVRFRTGDAPDRTGPGVVTKLTVVDVEAQKSVLAWTPPADPDFAGALVVRRVGAPTSVLPESGKTYAIGACLDGQPGPCTGRDEVIGWTLGSEWIDVTRPAQPVAYAVFAFDTVNNYSAPQRPVFVASTRLWWCPGKGGFEASTTETEGALQLEMEKPDGTKLSWPEAPVGPATPIGLEPKAGSPFAVGDTWRVQPVFSRGETAYRPRPGTVVLSDVSLGEASRIEASGPGAPVRFYFARQGWSAFAAEMDADPTLGTQDWKAATVDLAGGFATATFPASGSYRLRVRPVEPLCAPVPDTEATTSPEFTLGAALYVSAESKATNPTGADPAHAFRTIGAALAAVPAAAPKSIFVAEGTYAEALTVKQSVSLFGGYAADFSSRDVAARPTRVQAASPAITVEGGGLVIDGFAVAASGPDSRGVVVTAPSTTIRSCSFVGPVGETYCTGVEANAAVGVVVEDSRFDMTPCQRGTAILLSGCTSGTVRRNRASGAVGVVLINSEATVQGNVLTHAATSDWNPIVGVRVLWGSSAVVSDNEVRPGPAADVRTIGVEIDAVSLPSRVERNRLHGGHGDPSSAVQLVGASTAPQVVVNNLLYSGSGRQERACLFAESPLSTFTHNTCFVEGGALNGQGVYLWVKAAPTITNNLFFGDPSFTVVREDNSVDADPRSLENNAVLQAPEGWEYDYDARQLLVTAAEAEADLCAESRFAAGNVQVALDRSKVFVDVAGPDNDLETLADNDWSLSKDAPEVLRTGGKDATLSQCGTLGAVFSAGTCVTHGDETCGAVDRDFAGQPRTPQPGVSIGAFEKDL